MTETFTVTSKGQITLPTKLRKRLKIAKGEKLKVVQEKNAIKLVQVPKLSKLAAIDEEIFKGRRPSEESKSYDASATLLRFDNASKSLFENHHGKVCITKI